MNPLDMVGLSSDTPRRLDDLVKEHERLRRKFSALIDLLREKRVLNQDELARFKGKDYV